MSKGSISKKEIPTHEKGIRKMRKKKNKKKVFTNCTLVFLIGWTIGVLGFDFRWGPGIFLLTTASRTALGPTQPPIQRLLGTLSLGVKRPGREADHLPPSSAEVKE
jgi:hypothetical protein